MVRKTRLSRLNWILRRWQLVWAIAAAVCVFLWAPGHVIPAQSTPSTAARSSELVASIPDIEVRVSSGGTYDQLVQTARDTAQAEVARRFRSNPSLNRVSFDVMGKRGGSRVPLMRVDVGRSQWQQAPSQVENWSTVYSDSEVLLGFAQTQAPPPSSSQATVRRSTDVAVGSSSGRRPSGNQPGSAGDALARTLTIQPALVDPPRGLSRFRYDTAAGDFLDDIQPSLPGNSYLRWTDYPVTVFVQSDSQDWANAVKLAMRQWSDYVPLQEVRDEESADIRIYRVAPIPGISGAAKPEFFTGADGSLQHQVNIVLSSYQGLAEVATVTRHELGHALGLWGHTAEPLDLMYGGNHAEATGNRRVLRVATISPHDINTLKRVYEQPTLIGQ